MEVGRKQWKGSKGSRGSRRGSRGSRRGRCRGCGGRLRLSSLAVTTAHSPPRRARTPVRPSACASCVDRPARRPSQLGWTDTPPPAPHPHTSVVASSPIASHCTSWAGAEDGRHRESSPSPGISTTSPPNRRIIVSSSSLSLVCVFMVHGSMVRLLCIHAPQVKAASCYSIVCTYRRPRLVASSIAVA